MTFDELTPHRKMQIEHAARGMISGRLSEWPHLYRALESLGYASSVDVTATQTQEWCQEILKKAGRWA